jgi:DNA-binding protein HU-beta
VNKSELVERVSADAELSKVQAERAVQAFVDAVMAEVKAGRKVSLMGFGSFNPTSRRARKGRNPQTGAEVKIPASKGVRFSAGASFKTLLNTKGAVRKTTAAKATAAKATVSKAAASKSAVSKVATKASAKPAASAKAPARAGATKAASPRAAAKR